jgi:two-component system sensor histidine kinase DesK
MGRGRGGAGEGPVVRLAVAGIVAYAVAAPLASLTRYLQVPDGPVDYAVVAPTLGAVPLLAWLSYAATRGPFTRGPLALLAVVTAAASASAWIAGPRGWGQLYVPAALVAVTLPSAWSVAFLIGLATAVAPLAMAAGRPDYAVFYTAGVLVGVLPPVVGIRLVRSVRQLHAARRELAAEATARERLRIDEELTAALVGALTGIAERADRTAAHIGTDPVTDEVELRALGAAARHTLADARRVVRGYREVSLPAELATAATLLAAAGIDARIEQPDGSRAADDPAQREALRREIAALLTADRPTGVVLGVRDGGPMVRTLGAARTDEAGR